MANLFNSCRALRLGCSLETAAGAVGGLEALNKLIEKKEVVVVNNLYYSIPKGYATCGQYVRASRHERTVESMLSF